MADKSNFSEALEYHSKPRPGKIAIRSTKPTATQADLSLAYTPGVAEPCLVIADDPEAAFSSPIGAISSPWCPMGRRCSVWATSGPWPASR